MSLLSFQLPDKIVMEKADDFHGIFTFFLYNQVMV